MIEFNWNDVVREFSDKQAVVDLIDPNLEFIEAWKNYERGCTYRVWLEGKDFVLKIGEGNTIRGERRALEIAQDVNEITHLVHNYGDFPTLETERGVLEDRAAFLKEYFDGSDLSKEVGRYVCNKELRIYIGDKIKGVIRELNELGIANLDMFLRNFVLSPDETEVKLVELGGCKLRENCDKSLFGYCLERDKAGLEDLYIRLKKGKAVGMFI